MDRLIEIKLRMEKATPGPWVYNKDRHTHDSCIYKADAKDKYRYISNEDGGVVGSSEWIWIKDEDGEFIAHARTDIDFLLTEILKLKSQLILERDYFS